MNIVKGTIYVTIPIICSKCGKSEQSQPIKKEFPQSSVSNLEHMIKSTELGTSFPVGWGKFLRNGKDELDCPTCMNLYRKFI